MIYKAKKDKTVVVIPIVVETLIIFSRLYRNTTNIISILLIIVISSMLVLFILINMLTIKYIITDTHLIIKTCFFKNALCLNKIIKVERTYGGYSFSASSCKQLKLIYADNTTIRISPSNLNVFEQVLNESINSNII